MLTHTYTCVGSVHESRRFVFVSDPPLRMAPAKPRQYYLSKCYEITGGCLRGPPQCWEKSFGINFHSGFSDDVSFPTLKGAAQTITQGPG